METRLAAPSRYQSWSRFAMLLFAAAVLCHVGAVLAGPSGLRAALVGVAFFLGLWAYSSACVARAYWDAGDDQVPRMKRTIAGCVMPLSFVGLVCVAVLLHPLAWFFMGWVFWSLAALLLVFTLARLAKPHRWSEYRP